MIPVPFGVGRSINQQSVVRLEFTTVEAIGCGARPTVTCPVSRLSIKLLMDHTVRRCEVRFQPKKTDHRGRSFNVLEKFFATPNPGGGNRSKQPGTGGTDGRVV